MKKKLDAKYEHVLMLLFKFMLKLVGFEEIISAFTGEKHTHTCVYTIFHNIDFSAWP